MLEPGRAKLARPPLETSDQLAGLLELARECFDAAHLYRDFGERARRIRVQLRQPAFGRAELCLGRARPAARLVGQRAELALDRRAAADDLTQACRQGEIELLRWTAHRAA